MHQPDLQNTCVGKTKIIGLGYNEVIQHFYVEQTAGLFEFFGELNVGITGLQGAWRMIVAQNELYRAQF